MLLERLKIVRLYVRLYNIYSGLNIYMCMYIYVCIPRLDVYIRTISDLGGAA